MHEVQMPEAARRLMDQLSPLMKRHGLVGTWHQQSRIIRLGGDGVSSPVAITLTHEFATKFDTASAELQGLALVNIETQVELRYSPTSTSLWALDIKPDLRILDDE